MAVFEAAASRHAENKVRTHGASGVIGNCFSHIATHLRQFADVLVLAIKRAPDDLPADPFERSEKVSSLQILEREELERQAAEAMGWQLVEI